MLAADTPLTGRPSLALLAFGFATGYALTARWTLRALWGGVLRDRCGQSHP